MRADGPGQGSGEKQQGRKKDRTHRLPKISGAGAACPESDGDRPTAAAEAPSTL
jgi:hypothetical protein